MILDFIPPIIAHRGASAYAPENTLIAFMRAWQLGIKWVEFDVMLAKCGTPIIFHDETLDRTTNAIGVVDHYSYAHLCTLDAGKWFHPRFSSERIPTFKHVMEFLRDAGMSANIEIKPMPGKEKETVEGVVAVLKKHFYDEWTLSRCQFLFSSFSIPSLHYLREKLPNAPLGLLLENWEPGWEKVCNSLNCLSVHVDEAILTPQTAQAVKNMSRYLLCYTVNNPARARDLFEMGVDAVFSDCPDVIERELAYGVA